MRDDLHRSVAPRTAWSRVLRLACTRAPDEALRAATVRAVRQDTEWLGTAWGRRFEAVLELGGHDLFAQEKVRAELNVLIRTCPNQHARTSCEIALGQLAREGNVGPEFKANVMDQSMRVQATDCVELVSSRISAQFDPKQGALMRRRLSEVLACSDLTQEPAMQQPTRKGSVEADLDDRLEISL